MFNIWIKHVLTLIIYGLVLGVAHGVNAVANSAIGSVGAITLICCYFALTLRSGARSADTIVIELDIQKEAIWQFTVAAVSGAVAAAGILTEAMDGERLMLSLMLVALALIFARSVVFHLTWRSRGAATA